MGAEKFFDIKCRLAGLVPDAAVVVATVRALKHHGGVEKTMLNQENIEALERGIPNLIRHVDNIRNVYGLPCVVAINAFPSDTAAELEYIKKHCSELGIRVALSEVWEKGSEGGIELAKAVIDSCEEENHFSPCYELEDSIEEKLQKIVRKVYRGKDLILSAPAKQLLQELTRLGYDKLPVCVAKTQYSFSDNALLKGAPEGFDVTVRNLKVSAGAGFIVALTGDIMTMPGLPASPAAERIDVDEYGKISGLF